ncbi:unnamed protein product [Urochloa humidicola]
MPPTHPRATATASWAATPPAARAGRNGGGAAGAAGGGYEGDDVLRPFFLLLYCCSAPCTNSISNPIPAPIHSLQLSPLFSLHRSSKAAIGISVPISSPHTAAQAVPLGHNEEEMEFLYHSATSATVAKRRSLCRCSEVYVHPCLITQLSWYGIMLMLQNGK